MTIEEVKLHRLSRQHLLQPVSTQTAIRDLCGVQAQYLSHALHGLSLRCGEADTRGLIKSWTLRGTMHLFAADDLPLFLHADRTHFLRPQDTLESDDRVDRSRKAWFAQIILEAIDSGVQSREALKLLCRKQGMTDVEESSLFDPWGGIIRALCEEGRICHKVQQEKSYVLCPAFEPMDRDSARLELLRRYFRHFGPATIKDAAYFFGWPQREIKLLLPQLELESVFLEGNEFFIVPGPEPEANMPPCLFLAGFDQLMLGYEKKESLFLPRKHIRGIFTSSGIVRPTLLVNGTVQGYWNLKNGRLTIHHLDVLEEPAIREAAEVQFPEVHRIIFA